MDIQTLYARGAPIKVVCDEAGVVVLLEFVKINTALGWYCSPVDLIMNYSPDGLGLTEGPANIESISHAKEGPREFRLKASQCLFSSLKRRNLPSVKFQ